MKKREKDEIQERERGGVEKKGFKNGKKQNVDEKERDKSEGE